MSSKGESSDGDAGVAGSSLDNFPFESLEDDVQIVDFTAENPLLKHSKVLQEEAALFLSKIKELCGISQAAVDSVVSGVNSLIKLYNQVVQAHLCDLSEEDSIKKTEVIEFFSTFDQQTIFEGVQTNYKKLKYEESKWKEYLPPQCAVTSWKRKISHGKVVQVPDRFGYFMPFLAQLESILQCKDIMDCIDNPRPASRETFSSSLDGYQFQNHPVINEDPNAIAIVLYVDDVKPIESLSTYQGQEIRNYTWTIANIYPELRSSIKSIFLLAMAKSSDAKHDNKPYLSDFIQAINRLSSKEGVTFIINGQPRVFHAFLFYVIGDFPAQANLGGFKESSSLAYRPCRQCLITRSDLSCKYVESDVLLRNQELHKIHIAAVENKPGYLEEETAINEEEGLKDKPSVKYGVNRSSPLLEVSYFDVTKCLPQDIMHIFMEGILETACRLLLDHAVNEKRLPLRDVNLFLENQVYGHLQSDKPSSIESKHLKSGLRQTSSQMIVLSPLLPFIVKGHCDKEKLTNFLKLLMIFGMCMSFVIDLQDTIILKDLIKSYLEQFKALYPAKFVSKHHFLIHLPSQIVLFGPLPEQWAMRFEAFHAQYKQLFKMLHNSKNLLFSLITRITSKCSLELRLNSEHFLSSDLCSGKFEDKTKLLASPFRDSIVACVGGLSTDSEILTSKKLKWFGTTFQTDSVYPSVILVDRKSHELPIFATVVSLCSVEGSLVIVYRHLKTVCFWPELNAYEVQFNNEEYIGAMNITKYLYLETLMFNRIHGVEYVMFRQNSKPQQLE